MIQRKSRYISVQSVTQSVIHEEKKECPCSKCIVSTLCAEECCDLYRFINKAADEVEKKNPIWIKNLETLPSKLKKRIESFCNLNFRYIILEYADCVQVGVERKKEI